MIAAALVVFAACLALEAVRPGWRQPPVPTWLARAMALNAAQLCVVTIAGTTWERWLAGASLFHVGGRLPAVAAGVVAYVVATFVFYWWHRAWHRSDWLWRHLHQIHHSAQRIEALTSFYKHPLEMIANSLIGALLVYCVLGLDVRAAGVYTLCTAVGELFYHTNWRTPHWIGYVMQRPEMHRIHHQSERHRNNYGDIVSWDMLFRTYENRRTWEGRCGSPAIASVVWARCSPFATSTRARSRDERAGRSPGPKAASARDSRQTDDCARASRQALRRPR